MAIMLTHFYIIPGAKRMRNSLTDWSIYTGFEVRHILSKPAAHFLHGREGWNCQKRAKLRSAVVKL
jgi:hypothetical protein